MRLAWLLVFLVVAGILKSSASDSTAGTRKPSPKLISTQDTEFVRKYTLITGTDRGGELTTISSPKGTIRSIVVKVGLSNSDLIREFFFDENRLIEVQETRRTYSYNEKIGEIDFTKIASTSTAHYSATHQNLSIEPTAQGEPAPKHIPATLVKEANFFLRFLKEHPNISELDVEHHLKQTLGDNAQD